MRKSIIITIMVVLLALPVIAGSCPVDRSAYRGVDEETRNNLENTYRSVVKDLPLETDEDYNKLELIRDSSDQLAIAIDKGHTTADIIEAATGNLASGGDYFIVGAGRDEVLLPADEAFLEVLSAYYDTYEAPKQKLSGIGAGINAIDTNKMKTVRDYWREKGGLNDRSDSSSLDLSKGAKALFSLFGDAVDKAKEVAQDVKRSFDEGVGSNNKKFKRKIKFN